MHMKSYPKKSTKNKSRICCRKAAEMHERKNVEGGLSFDLMVFALHLFSPLDASPKKVRDL